MGNSVERSDALRVRLWSRDDGKCGICYQPIELAMALDRSAVNIDHIRPKAHGGSNRIENLQIAHERCNTAKGDSCPGCVECLGPMDNASRVASWRAQSYRCHSCSEVILPSDVNDSGKVGVLLDDGIFRLHHLECDAPAPVARYDRQMLRALVGSATGRVVK